MVTKIITKKKYPTRLRVNSPVPCFAGSVFHPIRCSKRIQITVTASVPKANFFAGLFMSKIFCRFKLLKEEFSEKNFEGAKMKKFFELQNKIFLSQNKINIS